MTCIAGVVHGSKVWIGGDSAGTNHYMDQTIRRDVKVFVTKPYIYGFCGSFRMGQLLKYSFKPSAPPNKPTELHKFMCTKFINKLRKCLEDGGFAEKENDVEKGGDFLVGIHGHLFEIASDYQVGESAHGYNACGSGDSVALGSLYTGRSMDPESRILEALKAATEFNAAVRPPYTILSV